MMISNKYKVIGATLIAGLAAGGWWYSRAAPDNTGNAERPAATTGVDRNRAVPALVDTVRRSDVPITIAALGTVTARQQAVVRPRVNGLLKSVHFTEGDLVKAGSVIARIDPAPYQAAFASARGQLDKDIAQLDIARTDLARYRTLLAQDSIASQQVDAQAALVKQFEGLVAADRGNLGTAQLNLSFATVTAPITGRTGLRQVDVGNMVQTTDTNGIVILTEVQPITVTFAIPQDKLSQLVERLNASKTAEQTLRVDALDKDGRTSLDQGFVLAVDNQTDPTTGSTKVKGQFPNANGKLFPGQFVNIRLMLDAMKGALTISQSAVQRGAIGTFVYSVNEEKKATMRKVVLGPSMGERVVILEGLKEGESIVIDGADKLREGAVVTTVEAPPSPRMQRGSRGDGTDSKRGSRGDGVAGSERGQRGEGKNPEGKRWNKRSSDEAASGAKVESAPTPQTTPAAQAPNQKP